MRIGKGAAFLLPQLMELADGMVRGDFQPGGVVGGRRWSLRDLLCRALQLLRQGLLRQFFFFGMDSLSLNDMGDTSILLRLNNFTIPLY